MRCSEADCLSRVLLSQASRQATGSLIADVRQKKTPKLQKLRILGMMKHDTQQHTIHLTASPLALKGRRVTIRKGNPSDYTTDYIGDVHVFDTSTPDYYVVYVTCDVWFGNGEAKSTNYYLTNTEIELMMRTKSDTKIVIHRN